MPNVGQGSPLTVVLKGDAINSHVNKYVVPLLFAEGCVSLHGENVLAIL